MKDESLHTYGNNNIINPFDPTVACTPEELAAAGFKDPYLVAELQDIIKDILQGDPDAKKTEEFKYLNFAQIETFLRWLYQMNDPNLNQLILTNPWMLVYKDKPPTPEEFLTHKYIGSMADSLYIPIKKTFTEFFDPMSPTRTLILNSCIGSGKSTVTCLMLLYVACLFGLMRDPWAYFAKAKTTVFGYALCAVTQTKAIETYVDQVKQLIGDSDFWMQCRTADEMTQEDKKLMDSDTVEYLPWTTAVKSAQPMDAKIKMSDGSWKTMGELKIGDKLYSPDYGESEVVAFPYHGYGECYEIELEDGRKTRCSIDHKWKVAWEKVDYTDAWDWHIVDTRFLLSHPDIEFEIYDKQPTL